MVAIKATATATQLLAENLRFIFYYFNVSYYL